MSREISISRKTITAIIWILILALILGGMALTLRSRPDLLGKVLGKSPTATSLPSAGEDQAAAVAGVTAIYTLDHTESADQYQQRVCQAMTADGCDFFKVMLAPAIRSVVEKKQVQTGCTVRPVQMVEEKDQSRVWLLEMTLDHPWEGMGNPSPLYAEVVQVNGAWQFNRIFFEQETGRYKTATP